MSIGELQIGIKITRGRLSISGNADDTTFTTEKRKFKEPLDEGKRGGKLA